MRDPDHQLDIVGKKVERYLTSLVPMNDPVLLGMEKDTSRRSLSSIGPLVGRIFSMILKSAEAELALEVGTSMGYSGIWIARSLQGSHRKLTTIELDQRLRRLKLISGRQALTSMSRSWLATGDLSFPR